MEQQKLIDWLRSDIAEVKEELEKLENKIDALLQFKWQIFGGTVVVSFAIGIIVQIIIVVNSK